MSFEPNRDGSNGGVEFLARGRGYGLFLTGHEAVLALHRHGANRWVRALPWAGRLKATSQQGFFSRAPSAFFPAPLLRAVADFPGDPDAISGAPRNAVLRIRFAGANPAPKVAGLNKLPGRSNYFIGRDRRKWRTNVPNYARVEYQDLYPGINLVYYGNERELEHDWTIRPGGDPDRIRFVMEGAEQIRVNPEGDLAVKVQGGQVRFQKPRMYQLGVPRGRGRKKVDGGYVLRAGGEIGFRMGKYDRARPLIIDPVLSYSTYLGGSDREAGDGIAVDTAGNALVVGGTCSSDFPVTAGAPQSALSGPADAFVSKFSADGSQLLYSTYFGGSGLDYGGSIVLGSSGDIYIVGSTSSSDFPKTEGAFQPLLKGQNDVFVAKLGADGASLIYSSYLGGSGGEFASGKAIALDSSGNAYVAGNTFSSDFPTTPGIFQPSCSLDPNGQCWDGFVSKISPDGSALVYSTYLGGSDLELSFGIDVDSSGSAYLAGGTFSKDFPTTPGVVQPACALFFAEFCFDAFVTKLGADGSALAYSTYLGGTGIESFSGGVALDPSGNAYVSGDTSSPDFPTTTNAYDSSCGTDGNCNGAFPGAGNSDAFLVKLDPAGAGLLYSTYVGGSDFDFPTSLAVNSAGGAFVAGATMSSDFPVTPGVPQSGAAGGTCGTPPDTYPCADAFVVELNAAGSSLVYSTYLGGQKEDFGLAIALNSGGEAHVTGFTESADFPTANALQPASAGLSDGFVAKIVPGEALTVSPANLNFGDQLLNASSPAQTVAVSNLGETELGIAGIALGGTDAPDFNQSNNCGPSLVGGASCTVNVTFAPASVGARTASLAVTESGPGGVHRVGLRGAGTDFAIAVAGESEPSKTINAGETASYDLTLMSSGFKGNVNLSCSGAPRQATCTPSPASVTLDGTSPASFIVKVTTTARSVASRGPDNGFRPWPGRDRSVYLLWALTLASLLVGTGLLRRRAHWVLAATVLSVSLWSACGGGGLPSAGGPGVSSGTPAGTYNLTVAGTSEDTTRTSVLVLTVN